jgi:hypothetical protein
VCRNDPKNGVSALATVKNQDVEPLAVCLRIYAMPYMAGPEFDHTTREGLEGVLSWHARGDNGRPDDPLDGTFCPRCGDTRRMRLRELYWEGPARQSGTAGVSLEGFPCWPAFFVLTCVQCEGNIYVMAYPGPSHTVEVVALPTSYGGLSTPHTPEGVAYYLDQAQRAQAVGALSGAVALYRAALEHLLFEQGYTMPMVGPKLNAIQEDSNAPRWYRELDPAYLRAIKDLGNAALHPNDGNVERQRILDARLLQQVRELFVELLDDSYERPQRTAERLVAMQAALATFDEQVQSPAPSNPPTA